MSTELQRWAPPGSDLTKFAEEAGQIHAIARGLAQTSFVPKAMQGRPDEITGAILAGRELGLPPMTALRSYNIIQGTPALEALAMRGLAQAAGIEFELVESTNTRCVMRARPTGRDRWTEVSWTIDDAKAMKLTGKDNWQRMPRQMLIARATSELCRLEAAHVLLGQGYSAEELADGEVRDADDNPATPEPAPRVVQRTAQREPIKASVAAPEPPLPRAAPVAQSSATRPDVAPASATPGLAEPPARTTRALPENAAPQRNHGREITDTTRKAVMASFNDINIRDRDTRMQRISRILGWDVPSVNMLTEDEGKRVVHAVKNGAADTATAEQEQAALASWGEKGHDWSDVDAPAVTR